MRFFALASAVFATVAVLKVHADCPSQDYEELNNVCYRLTAHLPQAKAVDSCDQPGESVLNGSNVALFYDVMALFLKPNNKPGISDGGPNPGRFFWTTAVDLNAVPSCQAGWSRSTEYVPADCDEFYSAICRYSAPVTNPNKSNWSAQGTSVYVDNVALWGPQLAIDGITNTASLFYHTKSTTENYEYLQIDLGREMGVVSVDVRGRTNCCRERFGYTEVRVGNTDSRAVEGMGSQLSANQQCGPNSGPQARSSFVFQCGSPSYGRYITVQKTNADNSPPNRYYLQIAEVNILAYDDQ